jgi:ligand-binding sensor domain-containing protein
LSGADVRDIVTTSSDAYALVAGQGVFSRVGKSNQWTDVSDTLDDEPLRLASTSTTAYAITATGSVYRYSAPSTAVGGWQKVTAMGVTPAAFAVGSNEIMWVAGHTGALLSRDTTTGKWSSTSKGLERAGTTLALLAAADGIAYAGTSRAGVHKWDATAKTWTRVGGDGLPIVNVPGGQANSPVNAVVVDAGKLYAATNHGVFTIATNATSTTAWTRVGNNLPEPTTKSLTTDGKGALIAGTLNGAYSISTSAATSAGGTWAAYGGTQGEVISTVNRVGTEVVIATKAVPGKAGRVLAGG